MRALLAVTELDGRGARELERRLPSYRHVVRAPHDGAYGRGVFSRMPLTGRVERFPSPREDPLAQLERFAGEVVPAVRRSRTDV